jgi:hypothetical protein
LVDAGYIENLAADTRVSDHAVFIGPMQQLKRRCAYHGIKPARLKKSRRNGVAVLPRTNLKLLYPIQGREQYEILLTEWHLQSPDFEKWWRSEKNPGYVRERIEAFAKEKRMRLEFADGPRKAHLYDRTDFIEVVRAMRDQQRVPKVVLDTARSRRGEQNIAVLPASPHAPRIRYKCARCDATYVERPRKCNRCHDGGVIVELPPRRGETEG